jgi:hypothetical protein
MGRTLAKITWGKFCFCQQGEKRKKFVHWTSSYGSRIARLDRNRTAGHAIQERRAAFPPVTKAKLNAMSLMATFKRADVVPHLDKR